MRFKKNIIFLVLMLFLLAEIVYFSNQKNIVRVVDNVKISFTHSPRFLDTILVNKLLTQNFTGKSVQLKESLDLNMLEKKLNQIPEIQNAELFVLPKGQLSVSITERIPTFKINSIPSFYADASGVTFPFVKVENNQLPVFEADTIDASIINAAIIIERLKTDTFIKSELKTLYLEGDSYHLKLKSYPFEIVLGNENALNEKIEKLKVFCAFQNIQDSLINYKKINLTYTNQVVATTL
jgi:cell division protein FtsQ